VSAPLRSADLREVTNREFAEVGRALSLAFEDDPVMAFLFPDAGSRCRRLRGFYDLVIPLLARHGHVHADEGRHAAAVWQAPSPPRPGRVGNAWLALRMILSLRGSIGRAGALNATILPAHLSEPHWYLALLGTEPSHQGRGLGSALLAPTLLRCDQERQLAYLESSKASNVPFYERHGFEVQGELRIPDGPSVWPMLRRPRERQESDSRHG
jgi:GNAT superfamily N-acetyltransferase